MNTKQVKVLFSYTESVVPPRCRKARDQRFHDGELTVDVRVVAAEDAPVGLIQTRLDYDEVTVKGVAEYRWFEGALWTNQNVRHSFGSRHGSEPEAEIDARDERRRSSLGLGWNATRITNEEHFRQWAESFILINGERWTQSDEPCYYVDDSHAFSATTLSVHNGIETGRKREHYYSLKELAKAAASAKAKNAHHKDWAQWDVLPYDRFQIVLPDCIRLNTSTRIDVTVFGLNKVTLPESPKSETAQMWELVISVPADAIASGQHIEIARREMLERHDTLPEFMFDEHSPAGMVIMGLRQQVKALMDEKATLIGTPVDDSPLDLSI